MGTVFGFELTYKVKGENDELALQKMQVAFERFGDGLERFGEYLWPKLTPLLEAEVLGQFEAQGRGPNRGHWAPLSPVYAARKEKLYPGKPILEASGALKAALTSENAAGALRVETSKQFQFGTSGIDYADRHQTGTPRMTDRPEFDFTPELEENIQRAAAEAARELARESDVDSFGTWSD